MTWPRGERLYHRLPEIYRRRDREQGEPLRAFLAIAESQLEAVEDDVAGLYENWFIETCEEWVVPYLGDLLGVRVLGELPHAGAHPRTQVAQALDDRQRKGTPGVLERVARDVVGWPARVVEMFEQIAWTQDASHVRPDQGGTFDVRRGAPALAAAESPFAPPSVFHTVDLRRIGSRRGRFNLPSLGLHLWRLEAFPVQGSPAAPAGAAEGTSGAGFRFAPLGGDAPLFNRLAPSAGTVRQAAETDLPVPITRAALDRDLRQPVSGFYGPGRAIRVEVGGVEVPASAVVARNLDAWGAVGLLSGPLSFPLTTAAPEVAVTLGGDGPHVAQLGRQPADAADAAVLLEAALRTARPGTRFASARVIVLEASGERLLAVSGMPGDRVVFGATDRDATSAGELGLDSGAPVRDVVAERVPLFPDIPAGGVAVDPERGRLLFAAPPTLPVRVDYAYGFAAEMGGGPYDRRATLADPAGLQEIEVAQSGAPLGTVVSLAAAFSAWTSGDAVIRILDNGLYEEDFQLTVPRGVRLTLEAADGTRPVLRPAGRPRITGSAGAGEPGVLAVNGLLVDGGLDLAVAAGAALGVEIAHSTLVPRPGRASLGFLAGGDPSELTVRIASSIVGALHLPVDIAALELADSLLDAATGGGGASPLPVLVSGPLPVDAEGRIPLAGNQEMTVTVDGSGLMAVRLRKAPAELDEARAVLQEALRAASGLPSFRGATVLRLGDRLLVRSGVSGEALSFAGGPAAALQLTAPPATDLSGLLSGSLSAFPAPQESRVQVTLDGDGPHTVTLAPWSDATEAAPRLEEAIHGAGSTAVFTEAVVEVLDGVTDAEDRLLVRPGVEGAAVSVTGLPAHPDTIAALGLGPSITAPEGTFVAGVFSGLLAPFPALSGATLQATFGGVTRTVPLAGPTAGLDEVAAALRAALRGALPADPFYTGADVEALDDRLLVIPGGAPFAAAPQIAGTAGDPDTIRELALGVPPAENVYGLLSSGSVDVSTIPTWTKPQLQVAVGTDPVRALTLDSIPQDAGAAREALQAALAGVPAAEVLLLIDPGAATERLLVRAGGAALVFSNQGSDTTAAELRLIAPDARALQGLLSGAIGTFPEFPLPSLEVTFGLGASARSEEIELAGFPQSLASLRELLEDALHAAIVAPGTDPSFESARVFLLESGAAAGRLLVASGQSGEAVGFKKTTADPNTVGDAALSAPAARTARPLLSGPLSPFPSELAGTVQVTVGALGPRELSLHGFPGNPGRAVEMLDRGLRSYPEPEYQDGEVVLLGDRLLVVSGVLGSEVVIDNWLGSTLADDLQLTGAAGSRRIQGRLSGDLATFPSIPPGPPVSIEVEIAGVAGTGTFAAVPVDLATAQAELQNAIRSAGTGPSFVNATVEVLGNHLFVTPGIPADTIRFDDSPSGPAMPAMPAMATLLELTDSLSKPLDGLLSGTGIVLPDLSLVATFGTDTVTVTLDQVSDDLALLATALQVELRAAAPAVPTFAQAEVFRMGSQLAVLAGKPTDAVAFTPPSPAPSLDLVALLGLGAGVATTVEGLLSGPLTSPPRLKIAPRFQVTLGATSPVDGILSAAPETLDEARTLLEEALHAAAPTPSSTTFTGATVELLGDRLLVIAGVPSDGVSFSDPPDGGTAPVSALGLGSGLATPATGVLSGDLHTVPRLTAGPRFEVKLGSLPPAPAPTPTAWLADFPTDVEGYRAALETAVRAAHPDPVYARARVRQIGDRFVVQPGNRGGLPVLLTDQVPPALAAPLVPGIALDGILSGDLAEFTGLSTARPKFEVALGTEGFHTVELESSPTNLEELRSFFELALQAAHSADTYQRATVQSTGGRLLITPGQPTDSIVIEASEGRAADLANLKLDPDSLVSAGALLTGPVQPLPGAAPRLSVRLGTQGPHLVELARQPTGPADAAALLEAALHAVTGPATSNFAAAAVDVLAERLHIAVPGLTGAEIVFLPVAPPDPPDPFSVFRLRLDAASAEPADGLLSGDLSAFPELGGRLVVEVKIGDEGPHPAELPFIPFTPAEARDSLEQAVRSAHASPAFSLARVILAEDDPLAPPPADPGHHLVLLPGKPGLITVTAYERVPPVPPVVLPPDLDPTAAGLRLLAGEDVDPPLRARHVDAVVSGLLPPLVRLTTPAPAVGVQLRSAGETLAFDAPFAAARSSLAGVAAALQAGIRAGAANPANPADTAASQALVALLGPPDRPERLVVLPGADGFAVLLAAAATDSTSVGELHAEVGSAVGASFSGEETGPPMTLVRSTIFGRLVLRQLEASETLFTEPVRVERRHVGCVRYCYVPEGSETPRRFRCQPDLALARTVREALETLARERGLASVAGLLTADLRGDVEQLEILQSARVHAALVPRFTSTRWGQPGYGQLRLDTAREIATGAEDGSEIGVFQRLHEPLRRRQLALLIEEYLRFGLDAGLFFLT